MKRILIIVAALFLTQAVSAQVMRTEELEKYAKERYGDKWLEAAANLASTISLDKNNSLTYTQVVNAPGKTKEQLYIILNYWYSATFNDANSTIKLNDKDAGVIIGAGYIEGVAGHLGGTNGYLVHVHPIIKTDIKDEKIRVTYTVQYYDVDIEAGGGIVGKLAGSKSRLVHNKWAIEKTYPFVEKDKHKKTSSKALIMTHAYSNVIMDKIEEVVKSGLVGNETEEW